MASLWELFWILASAAFVAFIVLVLWQILQALQGIARSLEDVAKTLQQRKSE
jgi:uncharacterized protein YoxC